MRAPIAPAGWLLDVDSVRPGGTRRLSHRSQEQALTAGDGKGRQSAMDRCRLTICIVWVHPIGLDSHLTGHWVTFTPFGYPPRNALHNQQLGWPRCLSRPSIGSSFRGWSTQDVRAPRCAARRLVFGIRCATAFRVLPHPAFVGPAPPTLGLALAGLLGSSCGLHVDAG